MNFCENSKKKLGGGRGSWGGGGLGFWGGVRIDVNEELKFLLKYKKKNWGGGGGYGGGAGWGGGGSGWM